jgi:hypothetical protein
MIKGFLTTLVILGILYVFWLTVVAIRRTTLKYRKKEKDLEL